MLIKDTMPSEIEEHFHSICPTTRTVYTQKRPYISQSMCQRQIALNGMLEQREVETSKALPFYGSIGAPIEEKIVDLYRDNGNLLIDSYKLPTHLFPEGVDLGGKVDLIINFRGEPRLIDIKTVGQVDGTNTIPLSDDEVDTLLNNGEICITDAQRIKKNAGKTVKTSYESQVQLYSAITGIKGYVMQVSRRVQDGFSPDGRISLKVVAVDMNDISLAKRMAVLLYGIRCRDAGFVPEKLAGIKKSHCSDAFCPFVSSCWDSDNEQILTTIPDDLAKTWKKECFDIAKSYVLKKDERLPLVLEDIALEVEKRQHIFNLMVENRRELEKMIGDYGLYPFQLDLKVNY